MFCLLLTFSSGPFPSRLSLFPSCLLYSFLFSYVLLVSSIFLQSLPFRFCFLRFFHILLVFSNLCSLILPSPLSFCIFFYSILPYSLLVSSILFVSSSLFPSVLYSLLLDDLFSFEFSSLTFSSLILDSLTFSYIPFSYILFPSLMLS